MTQKRRSPPKRVLDETIGQRLSRLRRERGFTQTQLAVRLNLSQANVSDYERDRVRLNSDMIVALTEALDISSDELLGIASPSGRPLFRDKKLFQELLFIERLPKRDKEALLRTIRLYATKATPSHRTQHAAAAK